MSSSFQGEKGPQGARGLDGPIGLTGPSGQTICHYVFPITTTTKDSELPSPYVGVSTATRWNTYRNSSVYPTYIAWNTASQLEATKLFVSWIDHSGVNVHNFMSMLRRNDIVTIQSKTNHAIKQEWKLNADPIARPNFMELSVTLAKTGSVQIAPSEHTHGRKGCNTHGTPGVSGHTYIMIELSQSMAAFWGLLWTLKNRSNNFLPVTSYPAHFRSG